MSIRKTWLFTIGLAAVACLTVVAQQADTTPYEEVRQAVEKWLTGMEGKVYQTTIRAKDGVSPLPSERISPQFTAGLFALQDGDVYIGIGFSKTPQTNSTLEELRATFKHIALDRIPVPGINATNWETRLMTPVSSFKEGVTLESWQDGVLRVRVQAEFFAVYGRRTDILVPAGAPSPPGTYFQIRRPVKADLVIEGRLLEMKK